MINFNSNNPNKLRVQFSSVAQSCLTLCDPMNCSMPGLPAHHQLPESTQTHVNRAGDAIQPCHPLLFPFSSCPQPLPASGSFPMSQLFASGGQSIGVSASASVLPMNTEDWSPWVDILAVQGTLKSLLQHHSSKASILRHSPFFIVQLSYPYMATGKTIALTRQTFVGKVLLPLAKWKNRLRWGKWLRIWSQIWWSPNEFSFPDMALPPEFCTKETLTSLFYSSSLFKVYCVGSSSLYFLWR